GDGADSSPSAGSRTGGGGNVDNSTTIQAVDVVRAWVDSRGRVEEAARRIGVHRHTMTKYIARIGEAMHVSMDDPGVMAELWYACRYTR
ncbi:helix-turn-helix domain-containing protein, partial [Pseudoscardovia radai]|uniref:helix-turn-helix domain-containing protein n=1 Tax=Pseudoscardovia radai TaxID=987066 RepID=UPI00399630BB